jgi:glucose uptake protein
MLFSMLCWGSWANAQKAERGWPFELFYWDYVWGLAAAALLLGVTLGDLDPHSPEGFFRNLAAADARHLGLAFAGGVIFNVGNVLLVAAIALDGMAVAFPIGAGVGLVLGVALNYLAVPQGNPLLLFGGIGLVLAAIGFDAAAEGEKPRPAQPGQSSPARRAVRLSLLAGVAIGLFYPLVAHALRGPRHLGPYTVLAVFAAGIIASAFPLLLWFMRHPLQGPVAGWGDYRRAGWRRHGWGWLAGAVWAAGTAASFAASYTPRIGPATAFAMGEGNTLISALWGVLVWREFDGVSRRGWRLLAAMFVCFLLGLAAIALAPLVRRF